MKNNLLYLNLAIDEKDTSLGFTIDWIKEISKNFKSVDVVTLRLNSTPSLEKNIKIYGKKQQSGKFTKYIYLYKTVNKLLKSKKYGRCFSHMSPISLLVVSILLKKYNIPSSMWFTHPGPTRGYKKYILYLAYKLSEWVLTASMSSFPYRSKKVITIGHSINLDLFRYERKELKIENFLILSRISRSKNIEFAIESFLKSSYKNNKLDIIGGTLNKEDENYLKELKRKYAKNKNINFLGKVLHKELNTILPKYDVNFNCSGPGFFDKSILETLANGIVNFYNNNDFDVFYGEESKNYRFSNQNSLVKNLNNLKIDSIEKVIHNAEIELENHSLSTLNDRLEKYI